MSNNNDLTDVINTINDEIYDVVQKHLLPYFEVMQNNRKKMRMIESILREIPEFQELIKENLAKGIQQKLFRATIDIDFTARIYFHGMVGIKDKDLFPLENNSMNTLTTNHLEYHLRGISTDKGIKELEKQL